MRPKKISAHFCEPSCYLVMVISTLQIYFLNICINGGVQLRNANRIGTENMLRILPAVYSDPCGKCFYFFSRYF